jgi:hypothetical protein
MLGNDRSVSFDTIHSVCPSLLLKPMHVMRVSERKGIALVAGLDLH